MLNCSRLSLGFCRGTEEQTKYSLEIAMSRSLGIPVKLLHEAAGHIVTVELKSGELYRGSMVECEDNWNCQLESITFTAKVLSLPLYSFSLFCLFKPLLTNIEGHTMSPDLSPEYALV